jgi:hypothetical protein
VIIANPIYDVVFKRLMENEKVAKFFIGTLLDQVIEAVEVKPQEFTFIKELDSTDPEVVVFIREKIQERLAINVFRLDFVATIKTGDGGYQKILIEIQKAKNPVDLMRFRNYLAEQYKKEDKVGHQRVALPITTIYLLGFRLPEIESPCIKVERNYRDLVNKTVIAQKSDFVEKLTHDSFVVQMDRITDRYQTRLDKLLSIFEQKHFTDDTEITKNFSHNPDLDELKIMTDILHHVGTDPLERKQIEIEQEAWRTINALFEEKEQGYLRELNEKDKALKEQGQVLKEQEQALKEQEQALKEQERAMREQEQALKEKEQAMQEKDRLIAELLKKMNPPT